MDEKTQAQYEYTNSKGVTYYLNNKGKLFFFSKDAGRAEGISLPDDYTVVENERTGLPMVKKTV